MISHSIRGLALLLVLFQYAESDTVVVSWYHQGTAQSNNSALSFNKMDTLNLACAVLYDAASIGYLVAITRGSKAPTLTYAEGTGIGNLRVLTISDGGTPIYDDFNGIYSGFEHFVVIRHSGPMNWDVGKEFRYMSVPLLGTSDAGTYYCTARSAFTTGTILTASSGGLTINVFTKSDQSATSPPKASKITTYSALLMGASKLFI